MTPNLIYWVLALLSLSSFCVGVATFAFIARRAVDLLKLENEFLAKRVSEQREFLDLLMQRVGEPQEKSDDPADWWKNND